MAETALLVTSFTSLFEVALGVRVDAEAEAKGEEESCVSADTLVTLTPDVSVLSALKDAAAATRPEEHAPLSVQSPFVAVVDH